MTTASTILDPDTYAAVFAMSLKAADADRDRSKQTAAGIVGVSDLFSCQEKVRLTVTETPWTNVPNSSAAWVGSAVHEAVGKARKAMNPDLLIEQEFRITLPSGLTILAHADEVDRDEPSVTDYKTKDGLEYVRKHGPSENERVQRALYYYGAIQAGLVDDSGICRNIWIDRSGKDPDPFVSQEPFDMGYVLAADLWLQQVVEAVKDGVEAPKEWPVYRCKQYCPWFTVCRGRDLPEKHTADPEIIRAATEVFESRAASKEATALVEQAVPVLDGFDGIAGPFRVRHTVVNGNGNRRGYTKVDVEKVTG